MRCERTVEQIEVVPQIQEHAVGALMVTPASPVVFMKMAPYSLRLLVSTVFFFMLNLRFSLLHCMHTGSHAQHSTIVTENLYAQAGSRKASTVKVDNPNTNERTAVLRNVDTFLERC